MLRYKSALVRLFSTMTYIPMLMFGSAEEKQTVSVLLFDRYEEDYVGTLVMLLFTLRFAVVLLASYNVAVQAISPIHSLLRLHLETVMESTIQGFRQ